MQEKRKKKKTSLPSPPHTQTHLDISIISPGIDSQLGCVEETEMEMRGRGKKESWRAEREKNMPWQQLVFGITELKVLHAWEVLSIC